MVRFDSGGIENAFDDGTQGQRAPTPSGIASHSSPVVTTTGSSTTSPSQLNPPPATSPSLPIPITQLLSADSSGGFVRNDTTTSPCSATTSAGVVVSPVAAVLSRQEAFCIHHFAEHLARWLDCTDASRQFTLNITPLAKESPILLYAVISYAARHMRDAATADDAQQRCVELLIPLLSSEGAANDEAILCAIVILRVCEQLSVTITGSDQERHLAGFSALLKSSQGRELDPSTPSLSQAAFWVYVRQCLYNACVNQQPPNIDFDLVMVPPPPAVGLSVDVKTETAWANTVTWICATVVRFCFGASTFLYPEASTRMRKWQELVDTVDSWQRTKPATFEPLWYSEPERDSPNPFPEIWFSSDWHVMAFGFYHLSCMLLTIYRPTPKFAVRSVSRVLSETDEKVMFHARALCGACRSSPATVPALITLCHSAFIWGPLMTDQRERWCVVEMLENMEASHAWPTAWIINALQDEWASS